MIKALRMFPQDGFKKGQMTIVVAKGRGKSMIPERFTIQPFENTWIGSIKKENKRG